MLLCPNCGCSLEDSLDFAAIAPLHCSDCGQPFTPRDIQTLPILDPFTPCQPSLSAKNSRVTIIDSELVYL